MANNRMYLRCKVDGDVVMLAKFYPGAWYVPTHSDRAKIVNEFFDEHQHGLEESNFGGYQYELEYEVPEERGKGK